MADSDFSAQTMRHLSSLSSDRKVEVALHLLRADLRLFGLRLLKLAVAELESRSELLRALPKDRSERQKILDVLEKIQ